MSEFSFMDSPHKRWKTSTTDVNADNGYGMNNDLISRSALIQHAYSAVVDGVEKDIIDLSDVDNAPTVPLPDFKAGYKQAILDGKTNYVRQQGDWNYIQAGMCVCPFCGAMPHKLYKNFCAKCGAKMKGGAENG